MVAAPPINAFKPAFRKGGVIEHTWRMRAVRRWIRRQRRATERAGLVASSSAQRLKPQAIDLRVNIAPLHLFLNVAKDTHSSLSLTQSVHRFRGAKWVNVKKPERRQCLKNAYRVLLTRGQQGMLIFVPPGAKRDKRRSGQQVQCRFPACSPSHHPWRRRFSR